MLAAMELTDPPAVETPAKARGSADYERVARAIAYLLRHAAAQPDLAAVARHVHLSEFHESPFGPALIASTARGVCALRFLERATERAAAARLREEWPEARLELDRTRASELGKRMFEPLSVPPRKPLALLVKGTNFQLQVWRALINVPSGTVTTYGQLAARTGNRGSARAVGNAVGANPVAYLIPCHRVIRESGALGGYRWGEARKAAMLGWEAVRATAPAR